jgi:hypothetical protein
MPHVVKISHATEAIQLDLSIVKPDRKEPEAGPRWRPKLTVDAAFGHADMTELASISASNGTNRHLNKAAR